MQAPCEMIQGFNMQLLMESHGGGAGPCVDISSGQRTCFTKAPITVPYIKAIELDGEAGSSAKAHPDDSCSHRIGTLCTPPSTGVADVAHWLPHTHTIAVRLLWHCCRIAV